MATPVELIGSPLTYTATTSSGSTQCTLPAAIRPNTGNVYEQLICTNLGTVDVSVLFTSEPTGTVLAGTSARGYVLLARVKETITVPVALYAYLAAASGTADVQFQRATGI